MKKNIYKFIIICFYFINCGNSQDIIFLKNGEEISTQVVEILPDIVKYKKWDNPDGPIYSSFKKDILLIKYKNGTKDIFKSDESEPSAGIDFQKILIDSKQYMDKKITVESEGAIFLVEFNKVNGVERNYFGQQVYTLEYSLIIKVLRDFWKSSSDKFLGGNWYWTNFKILPNKGDVYEQTFTNNYLYFEKGTYIKITGEINFEKTDNGMRQQGSYQNKTSSILANYQDPKIKNAENQFKQENKQKISRDSFIGETINGKRHGKGKMLYKNGEIYEGDWVDDNKEGFGTIYLADGSVNYSGEFKGGKPNGKGILYDHGRVVYDGNWVNGKKNGYGIFSVDIPEYSAETVGTFVDDKLTGEGEINYVEKNDNTKIQLKGTFEKGHLNGKGIEKVYLKDGDFSTFEGEFMNGEKWNGIYYFTDSMGKNFYKEYKNGNEGQLKKLKK